MPISVTCQCGARLEIDEKFLGKEIPCPDCQRPLPTQAPAKPPPLDLPNHRRKSGLAVLSLTLALVFGWVPIVGPLAAIAFGFLGLRQIAKHSNRLEGGAYARAGIVLGILGLLYSPAMLLSPMFVVYTDQFIRELKTAGKIKYGSGNEEFYRNDLLQDQVEIKRFDGWALWTNSQIGANSMPTDPMFLVNNSDDAYISCLNLEDVNAPDADEKQKRVLEAINKSQLVHYLAELRGRSLDNLGTVSEKDKKLVDNGKIQELVVDQRLGRVDRKLLVHYTTNKDKEHTFKVLVGACRRGDFERMQEKFREVFATIRPPL
jgi:hypothetical protein